MPRPYRILSIDGGGSWALIPVKALMSLYSAETKGHAILSDFDYVTANSGGSLVVAGLMQNLTLREVLNLFKEETIRKRIFAKSYATIFLGFTKLTPKYSTKKKLSALYEILGDSGKKALSNFKIPAKNGGYVKFSFMSYHYDRERAYFFRSFQSKAGASGSTACQSLLAEVVHASTNAPIRYFDEPASVQITGNVERFWDGAIAGYNNPVLNAAVEAKANGLTPDAIAILSLGTGNTMLPSPSATFETLVQHQGLLKAHQPSNFFTNVKRMITSILADPPDAHSFIAHLMLNGDLPKHFDPAGFPSPIIRMNPLIQPYNNAGVWELPEQLDIETFKRLVDLDMDATEQEDVELIEHFCDLWLQDQIINQPIRATKHLECDIGHPKFSAAKAAWLMM
ncbi:MAG: patatin-like phospholipase family protein [Formosimonas sp.]